MSWAPRSLMGMVASLAITVVMTGGGVQAVESDPAPNAQTDVATAQANDPEAVVNLSLPAQIESSLLAEMIADQLGISLQLNPQRVRMAVRLKLRGDFTRRELWEAANQSLLGAGFVSVLADANPLVYQVVPMSEAANLSQVLDWAQIAAMDYPPSYVAVTHTLEHLNTDFASQAVTVMLGGGGGQVRTVGKSTDTLLITGSRLRVQEALDMLARLDRPGMRPEVRVLQPRYATPARLQAAINSAWTARTRLGGQLPGVDIQAAPDGQRLILVAPAEHLDTLEALATQLDEAEPVITRRYTPQQFALDEVAALITETLSDERADERLRVVPNRLSGSLVVRASAGQHQRIEALMRELDDVPSDGRMTMRSFPVRHRPATALAEALREVLAAGGQAVAVPQVVGAEAPARSADGDSDDAGNDQANAADGQRAQDARNRNRDQRREGSQPDQRGQERGEAAVPTLVVDGPSNALIAVATPRMLERIEDLITRLDQRQPQVELEVTLVTLSDTQSRTLGTELRSLGSAGSTSVDLGSLFGLSESGLPTPDPTLSGFSGLGGLIINPGDYSVVVRALETVGDGRNVVRARVVVDNNADANLDAVIQEPIASLNASDNVATTTFAGTSDAGTQLTVTPTIGAGDQLSLEYQVGQSSFIGESTQVNGAVLPPTRRSDQLSSTATIPDGFAVALGGIRSTANDSGQSRIPWIGAIPVLGALFGSRSSSRSDGRFYVFIRARILRHPHLSDLKHVSQDLLKEAAIEDDSWPRLEARFID